VRCHWLHPISDRNAGNSVRHMLIRAPDGVQDVDATPNNTNLIETFWPYPLAGIIDMGGKERNQEHREKFKVDGS
jgi:hypothetical protein